MPIPSNIIANADDLGLNHSVNQAILFCFDNGYINSASFLTNTTYFDETIKLIHGNQSIRNIGVHVDLVEFKPVTNFGQHFFLDENGDWDFYKVNKKLTFLNKEAKAAFSKEIFAQIDKALSHQISITHLDSHCHVHTLPSFYNLFAHAAKHYKLKLRLAQTYYEGSLINFTYRKFINNLLKHNNDNYSDFVDSIDHFLKKNRKDILMNKSIEIILHPDFNLSGELIDHFDNRSVTEWIKYLKLAV